MIDLILAFLLAMMVMSAVIWAATRMALLLEARLAHWSALWAVALGMCVIVPVLGLSVPFLPQADWLPEPGALSGALPLMPLNLPMVEPVGGALPTDLSMLDAAVRGLCLIYLAGLFGRAFIVAAGRWQLGRIVRAASPFEARQDVLISPCVQSAFAYAPLLRRGRARVVISALYVRNMSAREIEDIIRHERQHLARRDDEVGLILRGLVCLCWVSPFAHSLFARWAQAIELQCDMAVTDGLSPRMRKAYAETLLKALHIVAGRVRQYPAASFSTPNPRKKSLRNEKMRIANIVTGTRPAFKRGRDRVWLSAAAMALTAVGTLGISATAQADMPDAAPVNATASAIVTGRMTAPFGKTFDPFKDGQTRTHWGVDIAAPLGTPVYAPAAGVVRAATDVYDNKPAYGNVVVLETEGGVRTLFSHLDGYTVEAGQRVTQGQQIATVGSSGRSTGPHVHIETYRGETRVDPASVWDLAVD